MHKREFVAIGVALIVALLAAFLAKTYLAPHAVPITQTVNAPPPPPVAPVIVEKKVEMPSAFILVAAKNIDLGRVIGKDDVKWAKWPKQGVTDKHFAQDIQGKILNEQNQPDYVLGKIAKSFISIDTPITTGELMVSEDRSVLSIVMGEGMRALTVPIALNSTAVSLLAPGDRVDVFAGDFNNAERENIKIENVQILALDFAMDRHLLPNVQESTSTPNMPAPNFGPPKTVTLEVLPDHVVPLLKVMGDKGVILSLRAAQQRMQKDIKMMQNIGRPVLVTKQAVAIPNTTSTVTSQAAGSSPNVLTGEKIILKEQPKMMRIIRGRSIQNININADGSIEIKDSMGSESSSKLGSLSSAVAPLNKPQNLGGMLGTRSSDTNPLSAERSSTKRANQS